MTIITGGQTEHAPKDTKPAVVHCTLRTSQTGMLMAFGQDAPLFAEGKNLAELRQKIAVAVRAYFGDERLVKYLIG